MSRFGQLEFDGRTGEGHSPQAVRADEPQCLAEARARFEDGEFEKALRAYSKALEFNPHSRDAWAGQVRALIELEEFSEAARWADKAREHFPQDPELIAAKAVALARNGELEEALALSDTAIEQRGDVPYVWLARGDVLLARREKRAEYCLEKALALARGDWFITWLAARVRFYHQQFALAVKLLQAALELDAGRAVLWLELSEGQWALGLTGAAERSRAQARQLKPELPATRERGSRRPGGWWRRIFGR